MRNCTFSSARPEELKFNIPSHLAQLGEFILTSKGEAKQVLALLKLSTAAAQEAHRQALDVVHQLSTLRPNGPSEVIPSSPSTSQTISEVQTPEAS